MEEQAKRIVAPQIAAVKRFTIQTLLDWAPARPRFTMGATSDDQSDGPPDDHLMCDLLTRQKSERRCLNVRHATSFALKSIKRRQIVKA